MATPASPPPRRELDPELALLLAKLGSTGTSRSGGARRLPWVILVAFLATVGLWILRETLASRIPRPADTGGAGSTAPAEPGR